MHVEIHLLEDPRTKDLKFLTHIVFRSEVLNVFHVASHVIEDSRPQILEEHCLQTGSMYRRFCMWLSAMRTLHSTLLRTHAFHVVEDPRLKTSIILEAHCLQIRRLGDFACCIPLWGPCCWGPKAKKPQLFLTKIVQLKSLGGLFW